MTLGEKIRQDLIVSLKKKDEFGSLILRLFLSVISNKEKEKRYKISQLKKDLEESQLVKESRLTDDETVEALFSEIKKSKEALLDFEKGKREDLAEKERKKIELWQKYLPEQLSEEEIKKMAQEVIERVQAKEVKDMGKVLADLMPKLKGRAEGSLISKIVKGILTS